MRMRRGASSLICSPEERMATRLSELHSKLPIITVDREDFRVYRRNKREIIPLICPPED